MKEYIEERVLELANYIIEKKTTVRSTAKRFGISKSTVHTVVVNGNGILILISGLVKYLSISKNKDEFRINPVCLGGGLL